MIQNLSSVPICVDTEGAQIRTGDISKSKINLQEKMEYRIVKDSIIGDENGFNLYPESIFDKLIEGDILSIDFDSALVQIIKKSLDIATIRVLNSGFIEGNKAVDLKREIKLNCLTKKDLEALEIAMNLGVEYFALSFANKATDVKKLRSIVGEDKHIFSKIESLKGLINFDDICSLSDSIIIDRGDLSRQIPFELIPFYQKHIIKNAKKLNKKVYVATNLLESMISKSFPTRAEVNDICSSLFDGADGLVLAAETAVGENPDLCVKVTKSIANQFSRINEKSILSHENILEGYSDLLIEPHGGKLVNQVILNCDSKSLDSYKNIRTPSYSLMDVEQIALGTFSPVKGFMNKAEIDSVLDNNTLLDGVIWSLPIFLQIEEQDFNELHVGDKAGLICKRSGERIALLHVEDLFTFDLDELSNRMFGTDSIDHPGVRILKSRGKYFVGGKTELIKRMKSEFKAFEFTPQETRTVFKAKGWTKIVGFHTRNVPHRAHEYIQISALENYHCDGLFIHPVIGAKNNGDFLSDIILDSYRLVIDKYYPEGKSVLGAFATFSRYCGPREALFTAICRKNMGCSHFIVGRDHTGIGKVYSKKNYHKLFEKIGEIGISPIVFEEIKYSPKLASYVQVNATKDNNLKSISGNEVRRMFVEGQCPPEWLMRKEISAFIIEKLKKGEQVFL
tara:strand:- start:708 stop:2744 length:2037 start_codon:yes stop_codon:yes gene_type:complete